VKKLPTGFNCKDCKKTTIHEYYMVWDRVWKRSDMKPDGGMLCIGCLEQRLGRKVTQKDFLPILLNQPHAPGFAKSRRLLNRLRSK